MLGLGGAVVLAAGAPSPGWAAGGTSPAPGREVFAEKFAADSADTGLSRTLTEQRRRAERLFAEKSWDEALDAYQAMASSAVESSDRASEAVAVLGMADCLSKPDEIDVELICGMYRHAGDAAQEAGDANVRFLALCGCAEIRRSCRMFQRSEKLWEAAIDMASASGNPEHSAFARSQLAMTLLADPDESNLDVVDESKDTVGHVSASGDAGTVHLHGGISIRSQRALKLLEETVTELPHSASTAQQVSARFNLAAALRSQNAPQSKRSAEKQMVAALELLEAAGGCDSKHQQSIEASLLELYEENAWLADGNTDSRVRIAHLRAKQKASRVTVEQIVSDRGKPTDPDERYLYEKAAWAAQKLEAMNISSGAKDDSDSDIDAAVPARPNGRGWQK
jgi:hypothetical protein